MGLKGPCTYDTCPLWAPCCKCSRPFKGLRLSLKPHYAPLVKWIHVGLRNLRFPFESGEGCCPGEVAKWLKASDCKSDIVGSIPTPASQLYLPLYSNRLGNLTLNQGTCVRIVPGVLWVVSSVGRALSLQGRSRTFEPCTTHKSLAG